MARSGRGLLLSLWSDPDSVFKLFVEVGHYWRCDVIELIRILPQCLFFFSVKMKHLYLFIAVLFIPWSFAVAKYDEFEDGDDIMEYDDNDFAEFEDVNEDAVTESPQRVITTEDDEEEATVELEGQDENQEDFDDADAQVMPHLLLLHVS